ncbi:LysR family transcriptional regulator [Qipengyuania sp. GH1]|uniref:LysR family transcriptional regulator n=1 Tax=Qipengyuania aestuarii TaxID=2867241 RepID=UPI001C88CB8C|nr:LysR family transcriptional regulator [Qipengyuania aestuarii]MBX7535176.1 LysR family transcriptional regulator [Qipengyuania aestuarii]
MSKQMLPKSISQLLSFVRIVDAGSFSEAARRTNTTTSAMSKAVSRLEAAHGLKLLNRSTHSLSLTPEGDRMFEVGKRLQLEVEEAEAAFADVGHRGIAGQVRISAAGALFRRCLMPSLSDFLEGHPDIVLEVEEADDFSNIAQRGIDLAIGTGSVAGLPGHFVRKVGTFPWVACASPRYIEKHGAPATPQDLARHALVGFRSPASRQLESWHFQDPETGGIVRHAPRPRHIFDDPDTTWGMITEGLGVGFGPAFMGSAEWRDGTVVEVLSEWRAEEAPIYVVRLDKRHTPQRVTIVQEFVINRIRMWIDGFRE